MTVELVRCDSHARVEVTASLVHWCPFKYEIDHGMVTIAWTTNGRTSTTVELRSLATWLRSFAGQHISHEDVTATIAADLSRHMPAVTVTSRWKTASMDVTVTAGEGVDALLCQPIQREDPAGDG